MPRNTKPIVEAETPSNVDIENTSDEDITMSSSKTEQPVPKSRKSVVDKIDAVIQMVEQGTTTPTTILKHLQSIRKTLDGAQIKSSKKTRKPNSYNIFMSEEMEKLKDSDMPATAKFKFCINKWNERKQERCGDVAAIPSMTSPCIQVGAV